LSAGGSISDWTDPGKKLEQRKEGDGKEIYQRPVACMQKKKTPTASSLNKGGSGLGKNIAEVADRQEMGNNMEGRRETS